MNGMRNAYALLGLSFLIVFLGAYILIEQANAPTPKDIPVVVEEPLRENTHRIEESMSLTLTSPVFENGGAIPSKYTCDGENINPEFSIEGIPEETESLVLVMDDPDIPESVKENLGSEKFDHWVLYNIPPETRVIKKGTAVGSVGLSSRGTEGYTGPCPPNGEHRYFFRLYALSGTLNFIKAPTLDEVEKAAQDIAIESATLMGVYERTNN